MSSILKALRKIEEEKRVANRGAPDLTISHGGSVKKSRSFLPLIAGVVIGAVSVGAFALWSSSDTAVIADRHAESADVALDERRGGVQAVAPAEEKSMFPSPVVTEILPAQEPVAVEAVADEAVADEAVADEAVAPGAQTLPDGVLLNVSETFYHDDPANSMAVVNDLPVMIGTFVETAEVVQIHSDKVVFRIDDTNYEIPVKPLP